MPLVKPDTPATGAIDRTFGHGPVITSFGQPAAVSKVIITPTGDIVASGKTTATLASLDTSELDVAVAQYTSKGAPDSTFNGSGQAIFSLSSAGAASGAVAVAAAEDFAAAPVSEFETIALQPSDATSLQQEFDAFEQSSQGVVAVTTGGELLDVGNSGVDTVEAEIVSSGVNLAAHLSISLPQAVVGGAAGTASIQISEGGNIPASGTFTIDLYASPDPQVDQGSAAFQSFPEKVNLKTGQSKTFRLKYAFPSGMADGNYYIVADVDTGSVRDLDESNNIVASSSAVDIAAPFVDLVAADLAVSGALTIGKVASISPADQQRRKHPGKSDDFDRIPRLERWDNRQWHNAGQSGVASVTQTGRKIKCPRSRRHSIIDRRRQVFHFGAGRSVECPERSEFSKQSGLQFLRL